MRGIWGEGGPFEVNGCTVQSGVDTMTCSYVGVQVLDVSNDRSR